MVNVDVVLILLYREQEAGNFLDKLLQIFQLVIEAPGSSYKNFLAGILQLCMDNVYPFLLSHGTEKTDAFMALLTLLHRYMMSMVVVVIVFKEQFSFLAFYFIDGNIFTVPK